MKPRGLSGFTVAKNCLSLDYCIIECIESLLPVCDEVVVGEMGSDDGTREMLDAWAVNEPKLRVVPIKDWTLQRGDQGWFTSALNETRAQLRYSMMLELDSDEILGDDPSTLDLIRQAVAKTDAFAFDRLNFARDPFSLIPEGECCGKHVVRIGPSHLWMPSDEPHPRGELHLLDMAHIQPAAKIFHLGFLRHPKAFFAKARVVLGAFFDNYDPRLVKAEEDSQNPMSGMGWYSRLTPYEGYHPEAVKKWCIKHGYEFP
jgi:hypothetical protein